VSAAASWCPTLGPYPAPGDPETVRELGRGAGRLAGELVDAARSLRGLARPDGLWEGAAARAYRDRLGTLPGQLEEAAAALARADRALQGFATELDDAQAAARRLVGERDEAQAALPDPAAQLRLQALAPRARGLRARVRAAASVAERALREAAALAPTDPGWLHRLVERHAEWIERASLVLSVAAAVATVSLGATGVGLAVAGGLAFLSAACTLTLHHYGEASEAEVTLALAGAMTFGIASAPAAAARLGVSAAPAAARAAAVAGRLPPRAAAVADATSTGTTAVSAVGVGAGVGEDLNAWRQRQQRDVAGAGPAGGQPVTRAGRGHGQAGFGADRPAGLDVGPRVPELRPVGAAPAR
jgi:uncharacterized protein YukE